jgi:hypothetical protein
MIIKIIKILFSLRGRACEPDLHHPLTHNRKGFSPTRKPSHLYAVPHVRDFFPQSSPALACVTICTGNRSLHPTGRLIAYTAVLPACAPASSSRHVPSHVETSPHRYILCTRRLPLCPVHALVAVPSSLSRCNTRGHAAWCQAVQRHRFLPLQMHVRMRRLGHYPASPSHTHSHVGTVR